MNFELSNMVEYSQTIEVSRRQQKVKEAPGNVDSSLKLEAVKFELQELKSYMSILGKEAAVEVQQQRLSLIPLVPI
ncbi:hypothetical protein KFK09_013023 [Dendrobium nobile]|uniref:Uncharacterized protein n=1 Tax=Dendrobium nobile TaxID=94219 RepID=A0A8T3BJ08_DENNO|nr:hypothetical protein KFK09_013023 [Dendrobium nobile]